MPTRCHWHDAVRRGALLRARHDPTGISGDFRGATDLASTAWVRRVRMMDTDAFRSERTLPGLLCRCRERPEPTIRDVSRRCGAVPQSRRSFATQHLDPREVGCADFPDPRRCSMIHCAACSINSSHAPRRGTSSRKRPPTPARTAPIVSGRSWRAPDGPDILDLFPVRCDRGIPSFVAPASGKKRHAGRLRIRSQLPLRSGKRPARPLRGCTP